MRTKGTQNIYFECPACHERFRPDRGVRDGDSHGGDLPLRRMRRPGHLPGAVHGAALGAQEWASGLLLRRTPVRVRTVHVDRHAERRGEMRLAGQAKGGFYPHT